MPISENEIMAIEMLRSEQAKQRQKRFFQVACDPRRGGMTLKEISDATAIPYNTIRSYAGNNGETAVMSWPNYRALCDMLPDYADLLNGGEA